MSANKKDIQFEKIEFQDTVDAAGSKAISESLDVDIGRSGGFKAASIDLDDDGKNELIVHHVHPHWCGSGGCTSYILKNYPGGWRKIGRIFPGGVLEASSSYHNGFKTIKYYGRSKTYLCVFKGGDYVCP